MRTIKLNNLNWSNCIPAADEDQEKSLSRTCDRDYRPEAAAVILDDSSLFPQELSVARTGRSF